MLKPYSHSYFQVKNLFYFTNRNQQDLHIQLAKIIHKEDCERFFTSRQSEYDVIEKNKGVTVVDRSYLPQSSSFVGERFVVSFKDSGAPDERFKDG